MLRNSNQSEFHQINELVSLPSRIEQVHLIHEDINLVIFGKKSIRDLATLISKDIALGLGCRIRRMFKIRIGSALFGSCKPCPLLDVTHNSQLCPVYGRTAYGHGVYTNATEEEIILKFIEVLSMSESSPNGIFIRDMSP